MKIPQILFLILGLSIFVNAQKAILSGTVSDEMGAVIPDLSVEFKSENGESFTAKSNEDGIYQIELPLGVFKVFAEFKSALTTKNIKIKIKNYKNKKLNIVLFCRYKDKSRCYIT